MLGICFNDLTKSEAAAVPFFLAAAGLVLYVYYFCWSLLLDKCLIGNIYAMDGDRTKAAMICYIVYYTAPVLYLVIQGIVLAASATGD